MEAGEGLATGYESGEEGGRSEGGELEAEEEEYPLSSDDEPIAVHIARLSNPRVLMVPPNSNWRRSNWADLDAPHARQMRPVDVGAADVRQTAQVDLTTDWIVRDDADVEWFEWPVVEQGSNVSGEPNMLGLDIGRYQRHDV